MGRANVLRHRSARVKRRVVLWDMFPVMMGNMIGNIDIIINGCMICMGL